jgi:hypothetical protein
VVDVDIYKACPGIENVNSVKKLTRLLCCNVGANSFREKEGAQADATEEHDIASNV